MDPSPPQRIAICVFGCVSDPGYCQQVLKIQETWGRRCEETHQIPVYYFLGEDRIVGLDQYFRYPHRMIYLPGVKNDYQSASYKQNLGLKYILDQEPNIDFVYVCGTDTYLNIDRLVPFLSWFDPTYKLCIGGHYNVFDAIPTEMSFEEYLHNRGIGTHAGTSSIEFFYGGAGFVLSKGLLDVLYIHLSGMTDHWLQWTSENGLSQYSAACDVCMAFYVRALGGKFARFYGRFFECDYRGLVEISHKMGYHCVCECCNKRIRICDIISCHNMSLGAFDYLHRILC
jgi:Fringe-like